MRLNRIALSIGCAALLLAGYGGRVYWQASHLTVPQVANLEKEVLKDPDPHNRLVLALALRLKLVEWPTVTGMSSGYSPEMFNTQEKVEASRTEHIQGISCIEEGTPPSITVSVLKGAYKPMEYYGGGFAGLTETEADFEAFAKKVSQVITYYSPDGGRTGLTTEMDFNARWRWVFPEIHPAGTAYPKLESACRRFDEVSGNSNALIEKYIEAIEQKHGVWPWMDAAGKQWDWAPRKTPEGEVAGLTLSGPPATIEKLRQELVTGMSRTGVPPWFAIDLVRNRQDWSGHQQHLSLTTFETRQGHMLALTIRKVDQNNIALDVNLTTDKPQSD